MNSYFFYDRSDREEYHTHRRDSIDQRIWEGEYKIRTQEASHNRNYRTNPEKSHRDISTFMELIETSEDITDLPELISDTRHLWTQPHEGHESNSEN